MRAGLFAILCVIGLQPIFLGAVLGIQNSISQARTWTHIRNAFSQGALPTSRMTHPNTWLSGGDTYTECIGAGVGLEPGKTVFENAIAVNLPGDGQAQDVCADLFAAAATPSNGPSWWSYARYWHGYRIYEGPAISALPFTALRGISFALVSIAFLFCFLECTKLLGVMTATAFLTPQLLMTDLLTLYRVTPDVVSAVTILVSTALFARAKREAHSAVVLICLASIGGSLYCFVDLLRNPPWCPMVLTFLTLADRTSRPSRETVLTAVLVATFWFGGYTITWVSKWLLTSLTMPDLDIMSSVLDQIKLRSLGRDDGNNVVHFPLYASVRMFKIALIQPSALLLGGLIFAFIRLTQGRSTDWQKFWILISPLLIAIAWFELLSNHTQAHAGFAYRSAVVAIGIILASVVLSVKNGNNRLSLSWRFRNGADGAARHKQLPQCPTW